MCPCLRHTSRGDHIYLWRVPYEWVQDAFFAPIHKYAILPSKERVTSGTSHNGIKAIALRKLSFNQFMND